jgi:hypothetical protein
LIILRKTKIFFYQTKEMTPAEEASNSINEILQRYKNDPHNNSNHDALNALDSLLKYPSTTAHITHKILNGTSPIKETTFFCTKEEMEKAVWLTIDIGGGYLFRAFSHPRVVVTENPKSNWFSLKMTDIYVPIVTDGFDYENPKFHPMPFSVLTKSYAFGILGGSYFKGLIYFDELVNCKVEISEQKGFTDNPSEIEYSLESNICVYGNRSHALIDISVTLRFPMRQTPSILLTSPKRMRTNRNNLL